MGNGSGMSENSQIASASASSSWAEELGYTGSVASREGARGITDAGLWARYIAKMIDAAFAVLIAYILGVGIGLALYFSGEEIDFIAGWGGASGPVAWLLDLIVTLVLFCVCEAMLVSIFGTTVGKSLMGIRVTLQSGRKLSLPRSVLRSFLSFVVGMAALIPVVSLIAMAYAMSDVKNSGVSFWDARTGATHHSHRVAIWRWLIGAVLAIVAVGGRMALTLGL